MIFPQNVHPRNAPPPPSRFLLYKKLYIIKKYTKCHKSTVWGPSECYPVVFIHDTEIQAPAMKEVLFRNRGNRSTVGQSMKNVARAEGGGAGTCRSRPGASCRRRMRYGGGNQSRMAARFATMADVCQISCPRSILRLAPRKRDGRFRRVPADRYLLLLVNRSENRFIALSHPVQSVNYFKDTLPAKTCPENTPPFSWRERPFPF